MPPAAVTPILLRPPSALAEAATEAAAAAGVSRNTWIVDTLTDALTQGGWTQDASCHDDTPLPGV